MKTQKSSQSWDAARSAARRPLPQPRKELAPVGERLEIGTRIAITRRHGWFDGTCQDCGFHVCGCHETAKLKASREPAPLSTQFERLLLTPEQELFAAEERLRVMRNSEEMLRHAKARLEEVQRQVAETAKHKELSRLQQAAQNLKQQTNPEFFFKDIENEKGQPIYHKVTLPLDWQVATYSCTSPITTAPAAGAFPSTADEFAKYAANRPPLRIDD
jgi:hypothetical protein